METNKISYLMSLKQHTVLTELKKHTLCYHKLCYYSQTKTVLKAEEEPYSDITTASDSGMKLKWNSKFYLLFHRIL